MEAEQKTRFRSEIFQRCSKVFRDDGKTPTWTKELKSDGTHDIKIYVYHKRKKMYYSTGISVPPESWDDKGRCIKAHPFANTYNTIIEEMVTVYRQKLQDGIPGTYPLDPKESPPIEESPQQSIIENENGRLEDMGERITYGKKDYFVSLYNRDGQPHFEVIRLQDGKILDESYKTRTHLIKKYKELTGM